MLTLYDTDGEMIVPLELREDEIDFLRNNKDRCHVGACGHLEIFHYIEYIEGWGDTKGCQLECPCPGEE